uniref:Uncharacterized protein n=1 Tax=Candidatus Kentrum sp. MB TaxID=2138164 RepID=A0A450Y0L6_9GAMM|nr:MAG: hypothetical protein BECKMB1821I_GA0114274_109811 [Candidatus Kentron sp. MB]VFK77148.1 MAG: hypothetical protein BECKMB1821H_GA0114242_110311 [Candidatus Kentron sp. MB]
MVVTEIREGQIREGYRHFDKDVCLLIRIFSSQARREIHALVKAIYHTRWGPESNGKRIAPIMRNPSWGVASLSFCVSAPWRSLKSLFALLGLQLCDWGRNARKWNVSKVKSKAKRPVR